MKKCTKRHAHTAKCKGGSSDSLRHALNQNPNTYQTVEIPRPVSPMPGTPKMKKGGLIRGCGAATRGNKFKG